MVFCILEFLQSLLEDGNLVVTLWPNIAFLPKVLSCGPRHQPIYLAQFEPPLAKDTTRVLCPVQALASYIDATAAIRQMDQLFMCFRGRNRGHVHSRQHLSHWIVDTISCAYRAASASLPAGIRCHSTRGVSTSWAALKGVPLDDICPMGIALHITLIRSA